MTSSLICWLISRVISISLMIISAYLRSLLQSSVSHCHSSRHSALSHICRLFSTTTMTSNKWYLNQTLDESDPQLFEMIQNEKRRQKRGLEMIASENFTSLSVLQCLSSCLHNKYSEGYPGQRFAFQFLYIKCKQKFHNDNRLVIKFGHNAIFSYFNSCILKFFGKHMWSKIKQYELKL